METSSDFHPFLDKSLKFKWSEMTPSQARIDIRLAIDNCQKRIDDLILLPENEISYETTFKVYDRISDELGQAWSLFTHLNSVRDSKDQRLAFKELNPVYTDFSTSIDLNPKLWALFKKANDIILNDTEQKGKLENYEIRFIEKTLNRFKRHGADLDDESKEEIARINKELAEVTDKYKKNQLDSRVDFEFFIDNSEEDMLEGLPQSAIDMLFEMSKDFKDEVPEIEENDHTISGNCNSLNNDKNSNNNISSHDDKNSKENGNTGKLLKYRFTLEAPLSTMVMKYAKKEELRKKMWDGMCSIGYGGQYDNTENVFKILSLRDRKAKILGYDSFADYMTEIRMTKTGDKALHFVDDLHDRCYQKYLEEKEEIRSYKAKIIGQPENAENIVVFPWEKSYYAELLRKEKYDFDDELLRPYFTVDNVMKGVFLVASTIYGIDVREKRTFCKDINTNLPPTSNSNQENPDKNDSENHSDENEDSIEVWNKDVKYFEVYDKESGELIGAFFADWHPREDKRSGAWEKQLVAMSSILPKNIATLNGNLPKPVCGKPSLLTRREAQTIFHEFGHLCHFLLSKSPIKSLAGTHVLRDFVEFPSRFLENWTWDRSALDLFASHFETGEKIPQELFDKMVSARNYHSATALMGQLSISKIDMELHRHFDRFRNRNIEEINDEILEKYQDPKNVVRGPSLIYNSRHLFASPVGYAADYYSYKWSEMLEADVFTRFHKEGIMNETLGHEIRDKIISQGDMKSPDELFRDFMGRDPDPTAFFRRYGID